MKDIMTIQNVRGYLDAQGTAWLNAEDVARGLGFTETAASGNITIRWRTVRTYLADFGYQPVAGSCDDINGGSYIPENMFYRLAMKAKNAAAEKFQAKVADEILPSIRKTGSYSVKASTPVADIIADVSAVAQNIQSLFGGVQRGIAIAQAIDLVGSFKNFSLDSLKRLLPPAQHTTGHLNATQIGELLEFGKGRAAARKANAWLKKAEFQYHDGKSWRLTDVGKCYGEEMPYTKNGHSGYQIRWNENVVNALRNIREVFAHVTA